MRVHDSQAYRKMDVTRDALFFVIAIHNVCPVPCSDDAWVLHCLTWIN